MSAAQTRDVAAHARPILPWWLVGSVALGTLLNPLNSSMIAVALFSLGAAFQVPLVTATWLVSSFYLAGAVGATADGASC